MPSPSDTGERLARHYWPFPSPSDETYDIAQRIWRKLDGDNVCTHDDSSGIIGVASAGRRTYVGFSTTLNTAVQRRYRREQVAGRLSQSARANLTYCRELDEAITQAARFSPGCAEKRIMARARADGLRLDALFVAHYSFETHPDDLSSHLVLASADTAYYAPCDSCKRAYAYFF